MRQGIVPFRPCCGKHRPSFAIKHVRVARTDDADQAIKLQAFRGALLQQAGVVRRDEQAEEIALLGLLLEVATNLIARSEEPDNLSDDVIERHGGPASHALPRRSGLGSINSSCA